MGAVESIGALCLAIGLSLGGVLVALSSPRVAFLVIGLGATVTTAALLRLPLTSVPVALDGDSSVPVPNPVGLGKEPLPHEAAPQ
jgi:hypothetical protein